MFYFPSKYLQTRGESNVELSYALQIFCLNFSWYQVEENKNCIELHFEDEILMLQKHILDT